MSTVTLVLEVPEWWIIEMVLNVDVFRSSACGYWARGVAYDDELGWLVWEPEHDAGLFPRKQHDDAVFWAWRHGERLPAGYHRFDRQLAIDAFGQVVLIRGQDPVPDANDLDRAIQRALFGEERYG
jgi:hypothetical protein